MAALPYMQLYVADYLADTAHLSTIENGAYLLLIFNYWQRGESFKAKDQQSLNKRLASVARMSSEEWETVKELLAEFFEISETEWKHLRIDRDLGVVNAKSEKAKAAGKASAASKANARSTLVEQTFNHTDVYTDTDVDTNTEKQKTKLRAPRFDALARLVELDVDPVIAADWIKHRKNQKAEVTPTVIDGISRESEKAGMSLEAALRECCIRGWRGFKAEWMQARDSPGRVVSTVEQRNKAVAAAWVPPEMRGAA